MRLVRSTLFVILFLNFQLLLGQTINEQLDENSMVDWARLVIRSSGNSAIPTQGTTGSERVEAMEKARLAAEQNLFEAAKRLPLTANLTVGETPRESLNNLRQLVKRFTIVDTRSMSDMTVEVDVELPLSGAMASVVIPADFESRDLVIGDDPLCPTCGQPWPKRKAVPAGVQLIVPSNGYLAPSGKPFTGLVIDARDLDLSPVWLPEVLDEENAQIYGSGFASMEAVVSFGLVAYKNSLESARKDPRAGSEPLVIRAIAGTGGRKANVVVSNSDAVLIHAAAKANNFLKECKVIIVI